MSRFYKMPDGRILEVSDDSAEATIRPEDMCDLEEVLLIRDIVRPQLYSNLLERAYIGVKVNKARLIKLLTQVDSDVVELKLSYDDDIKAGILNIHTDAGEDALLAGLREIGK